MKQLFIFFIYFSTTVFACFSQHIGEKYFFSKDFGGKYTTWQLKLANKKSFVFCAKPNFTHNRNPKMAVIVIQNKNKSLFPAHKNKKIRIFIHSGQRLNKALSFSSKALLAEISSKLATSPVSGENIPEIANPSFLKMTLENLKIPENRIGIYTYTIMRNDTWRSSNILSNRADARLRPYSAINQRNTIILLGVSIAL